MLDQSYDQIVKGNPNSGYSNSLKRKKSTSNRTEAKPAYQRQIGTKTPQKNGLVKVSQVIEQARNTFPHTSLTSIDQIREVLRTCTRSPTSACQKLFLLVRQAMFTGIDIQGRSMSLRDPTSKSKLVSQPSLTNLPSANQIQLQLPISLTQQLSSNLKQTLKSPMPNNYQLKLNPSARVEPKRTSFLQQQFNHVESNNNNVDPFQVQGIPEHPQSGVSSTLTGGGIILLQQYMGQQKANSQAEFVQQQQQLQQQQHQPPTDYQKQLSFRKEQLLEAQQIIQQFSDQQQQASQLLRSNNQGSFNGLPTSSGLIANSFVGNSAASGASAAVAVTGGSIHPRKKISVNPQASAAAVAAALSAHQKIFASSDSFATQQGALSSIGMNNVIMHGNQFQSKLLNPYQLEKRTYKQSRLPMINRESEINAVAVAAAVRSNSREQKRRFQPFSINIAGNERNGLVDEEPAQLQYSARVQGQKAAYEDERRGVGIGSGADAKYKFIDIEAKENEDVSVTQKEKNKSNQRVMTEAAENEEDDIEKQKCVRYFRYNVGQLLNVLGKKESYFANLMNKKPIQTFLQVTQSLGKRGVNSFPKNTIAIINKVKKLISTKGKYKYRERFNFMNSAQLKAINYDVKKRITQVEKKASSTKQKEEESSSDEEVGSPQKIKSASTKDGSQCTDLTKWKKINKLDMKTKVFIIKGGYNALRKALLDRGWYENPDKFSPCFDFKWTCKVQNIDYDNLLDFQVVNHFDNNQVFTSKYGISRNLRTLIHSDNIDVYKFFPRCFDLADLQEFEDFIENFKTTKAESLLYKYFDMLSVNHKIDDKLELKIRTCVEIVSRKFIDILEQINLIYSNELLPCVSSEEWEIICKEDPKIDSKKLEHNLEKLRIHPSIQMLIPQKRALKHKQNQSTKVEKKQPHSHQNHQHIDNSHHGDDQTIEDTENEQNERRLELYELCKQTLQRSASSDPQHHLNGFRNIWIVKPNFLSRGRGIKCFNNLDKIMDYVVGKDTQFVVQKYIENPLLINNKKFDMRQWAIVQDFCPPRIWFYDECYIRLCSVDHDIDDLNNRFVHLTNNIIQKANKEGYADKDDLMWKQSQFADYLKETEGRDVFYDEIQPKLKQMVIQSLRCCQDQVGARKNSMEFVGYDFMVDSNYQPWLIEINSSPSMEYSTSITKDLVQRVLEDTTKVVVDYSMAKKGTKKNIDTGGFKLIYKGDKPSKSIKVPSFKK